MDTERIGVIGAGIVGLAVARRLGQRRPDAEITVVEKELGVARHQSAHNSGVVHAGLYYAPDSLKARLCNDGRRQLRDYCRRQGLAYEECGKVVVALDDSEIPALRAIEARARVLGVPGLRWLDHAGLVEIEPHVAGVAALHSPQTAIVDFAGVAASLAAEIVRDGGQVLTGHQVDRIDAHRGSASPRVGVGAGEISWEFDRLVICAGLHADRLARMAGDEPGPQIVPFRGEYLRLVPARTHLVRGLVYPVPDPRYPFLGVHFTRRLGGSVDVGPNAVLALAREGYGWRDVVPGDVIEMLRWPGFRRMAVRHWRAGMRELWESASTAAFVGAARRYVPELTGNDVVAAPAGVRAQALDKDGTLVDDFRIARVGPVVAVRNAPSPAATSSFAIADHIADMVLSEP